MSFSVFAESPEQTSLPGPTKTTEGTLEAFLSLLPEMTVRTKNNKMPDESGPSAFTGALMREPVVDGYCKERNKSLIEDCRLFVSVDEGGEQLEIKEIYEFSIRGGKLESKIIERELLD